MFCRSEQEEDASVRDCVGNGEELAFGAESSLFHTDYSEMAALSAFSARLGCNPLLVQASSGNTSLKADGVLWIKASGKWLQNAEREQVFVPIPLLTVTNCLQRDEGLPSGCGGNSARPLAPSIETFMHAVLPHRVVAHVHSVNTIAWAVRQDAEAQLSERLSGLNWCSIPYASSGAPLAREVEKAICRDPRANVFVLANHGLVVCGDDCDATEELLSEVERRLEIQPRRVPQARRELLAQLATITNWVLPDFDELHVLGTDSTSRRILRGGVLYPCQALFIGRQVPLVPCSIPLSEVERWMDKEYGVRPFAILEGSGTLVSASVTSAELEVLRGLAQVTQRLHPAAPIRYLSEEDVTSVLSAEGYHYRDLAEKN
jgi:rhamnose utilization protein RhaD (predicted bifunctional aldolase and dehydrogenase)